MELKHDGQNRAEKSQNVTSGLSNQSDYALRLTRRGAAPLRGKGVCACCTFKVAQEVLSDSEYLLPPQQLAGLEADLWPTGLQEESLLILFVFLNNRSFHFIKTGFHGIDNDTAPLRQEKQLGG